MSDPSTPQGTHPGWSDSVALALVQPIAARPGPLLPALHALQQCFGYVPAQAVQLLANELNLSRAEVHGVITFYDFFRTAPGGKYRVRICQAEACQAMGSAALTAHAKARLGIDFHQTTANGAVTLEPVYCLGNCACAPAMLIDDRLYGRLNAARFDALVSTEVAP
jgi:formate dehydrogenase subunit gamma